MAYRVDYFDSSKPSILVHDGTLNKDTHITLVGKNWYGYGEAMAENLLHLLENFASEVPPAESKAVPGQLWFKKVDKDGDGIINDGEFYYFDGDTVSDPINYPRGKWRGLRLETVAPAVVKDIGNVNHTVTLVFDEGNIIAVVSSEEFEVHADDTVHPQFNNIGAGITVADGCKFHGTATSAQYADLAEYYSSDTEYEPGTVLKIGGEAEVTQTTTAFCPDVFGVVSTDPAYLMNSNLGGTRVAVALEGRVPVKVIGQVKKGQRLLSSEEPGVARAPTDYEMQEYMDWYRIVGRALEDKTTEGIGLVEVAVGVK
jgi:hypothetical protein